MDFIKLQIEHLIEEPMVYRNRKRYSHRAFTRKFWKDMIPCDYDKNEKVIEFEFTNGDRNWFKLETIFGKVISETKSILILYPGGKTDPINIVSFEVFKVKRTMYLKIIFEQDFPF